MSEESNQEDEEEQESEGTLEELFSDDMLTGGEIKEFQGLKYCKNEEEKRTRLKIAEKVVLEGEKVDDERFTLRPVKKLDDGNEVGFGTTRFTFNNTSKIESVNSQFFSKLKTVVSIKKNKEVKKLLAKVVLCIENVDDLLAYETEEEVVEEVIKYEKEAQQLLSDPELFPIIQSKLTMKIKRDETVRDILFLTCVSAYSKHPINTFQKGPSSIGKTYLAVEVANFFPDEDIWFLAGMSPKALYHEHGDVDKKCNRVVNLWNKIIIFVDAPEEELLAILKPILSHDKEEITYKFADKGANGLRTVTVTIRGWPATIFCTTQFKGGEEMSTRGFTVTPEMTSEKYHDAIKLIGQESAYGEASEEDRLVTLFRDCARVLKKLMRTEFNGVRIPYMDILSKAYPHEFSRDIRDFRRLDSLIEASTIFHAYRRVGLVIGDKKYLIANQKDFEISKGLFEKVFLTTREGISQALIDCFNKVVYEEAKTHIAGAPYDELMRKYYEVFKKPIGRSVLYEKFIKPMEQLGWVEINEDEDDRRRRLIDIPPSIINRMERTNKNVPIVSDSVVKDFADFFSEKEFGEWLDGIKKYNVEKSQVIENFFSYDSELEKHIQKSIAHSSDFFLRYIFSSEPERQKSDLSEMDNKIVSRQNLEDLMIEWLKDVTNNGQDRIEGIRFNEKAISLCNGILEDGKQLYNVLRVRDVIRVEGEPPNRYVIYAVEE